ncbi:MAG: hypothetical protein WEA09_06595 [Gemmatimonadota bacterium]
MPWAQMGPASRYACVVALLVPGVACDVAEPEGVTVTVRGGGGEAVFHVVSTPRLEELTATGQLAWTSTGVGFFRIADGRLMPDGSVWVLDGGARTVLSLANDGELRSVLGREGEGPGEFRVPSRIVATFEHGVWVWDSGLRRLTAVRGDRSAVNIVTPRFPPGAAAYGIGFGQGSPGCCRVGAGKELHRIGIGPL